LADTPDNAIVDREQAPRGVDNVTKRVKGSSGIGLVIGTVAVVFLLYTASPVLGDSCSVVGTFVFTVTGGYGTLFLRADGSATMNFASGHGSFCETCLRLSGP